jgi:cold shock protein
MMINHRFLSQDALCDRPCNNAETTRNSIFEEKMMKGTVKWFNPTKGFGFISPDDSSNDVFVHISAVEQAGMAHLTEGQRIAFELVSHNGKTSASELTSIND